MALIGEPKYRVQVNLDEEGNARARVFATATYVDRTATAYRDSDEVPESLVKALQKLVKEHERALEMEVTDHAYQAMSVARRQGEFDEDGTRTLTLQEQGIGGEGGFSGGVRAARQAKGDKD